MSRTSQIIGCLLISMSRNLLWKRKTLCHKPLLKNNEWFEVCSKQDLNRTHTHTYSHKLKTDTQTKANTNHFYYPTNVLNFIKLRDWNLRCVSFKRQLKITPPCFGSCAIHHQGVLSCAWLKLLLVIHRYFSCAWSEFGSVILNLRFVCTCSQRELVPSPSWRAHTP